MMSMLAFGNVGTMALARSEEWVAIAPDEFDWHVELTVDRREVGHVAHVEASQQPDGCVSGDGVVVEWVEEELGELAIEE